MTALLDISEKEWAAQVYDLARTFNWRRYHTYRSERSPAGFPDEVLVRDRVIFVELKRESGKVSLAQAEWILALRAAGAEAYVWRPSDLDEVGRVLTSREREAA